MKRWLPKDRLGRLFVVFVTANAIMIAVLGWQAVESQEVKGALEARGPVRFEVTLGGITAAPMGIVTGYVNVGDRTLTLESAELLDSPENLELLEIGARRPGAVRSVAFEGFEVAPGSGVEVVALVDAEGRDAEASFQGLRLHYRAGGRSGLTP